MGIQKVLLNYKILSRNFKKAESSRAAILLLVCGGGGVGGKLSHWTWEWQWIRTVGLKA